MNLTIPTLLRFLIAGASALSLGALPAQASAGWLQTSGTSAEPTLLIRVDYSGDPELERIVALSPTLRYCDGGTVLVSGSQDDCDTLVRAGLYPRVLSHWDAGHAFYLTDVDCTGAGSSVPQDVIAPLPGGLRLVGLAAADARSLSLSGCFLQELPTITNVNAYLTGRQRSRPSRPSSGKRAILSRIDSVSQERMMAALGHLVYFNAAMPYSNHPSNLRSRYARRPEALDAARFIAAELASSLGDENVAIVPFKHTDDDSTMYNVVGTLAGSDPDAGYYAITGHYDSIALRTNGWRADSDPAPGADDNATGSAAVIEAARVLSGLHFPWSIKFIAFSGEELGLWGSRIYASSAEARGDKVLGVVNLDMLAYNNSRDRLQIVASPGSAWLAHILEEANSDYGIGLEIDVLVNAAAKRSDHAPFWDHGFDSILVIEGYPPEQDYPAEPSSGDKIYRANAQIHTIRDVADSLNVPMFKKAVQLVVAGLAQFAESAPSLPDLAILPGDVRMSATAAEALVTITNLGRQAAPGGFRLDVSACRNDSSDCSTVSDTRVAAMIPQGGAHTVRIPWSELGDAVLSATVDPDSSVPDPDRTNNKSTTGIRAVSHRGLVVFPNPFVVGAGEARIAFSGLSHSSRVSVFTASGELVWTGAEGDRIPRDEAQGEVIWDGVTSPGFLAGSGTYLYQVVGAAGQMEATGKLGIVR